MTVKKLFIPTILLIVVLLAGCLKIVHKKASLEGDILDEQKNLVEQEVLITLGEETLIVNDGHYLFLKLVAGIKDLKVEAAGYNVYERKISIRGGINFWDIRLGNLIDCLLEVDVEPEGKGTVTGGGTYPYGSEVTLKANPSAGYLFINWTEGGEEVSTLEEWTFLLKEDREITANFALEPLPEYQVNLRAEPSAGGTVNGGGSFTAGSTVTVLARAKAGYYFINWQEEGQEVSIHQDYGFVLEGDRELVAHFQEIPPTDYLVELISSPQAGGILKGAGTYPHDSQVSVSAFANPDYLFLNWTEGENLVSEDEVYTFILTRKRTLVANFELQPIPVYTISLEVNEEAWGSVSGGGTYPRDTEITVSASHLPGYRFVNWTSQGEVVSTQANYTFIVQENLLLRANFELAPTEEYKLTLLADPVYAGIAEGDGTYLEGTEVTVCATAFLGFAFVNWTLDGEEVSADKEYSFILMKDTNLIANFEEVPIPEYTVTLVANPLEGGTLVGGGTFPQEMPIQLSATPASGYVFVNWTLDGEELSTNEKYTITVTRDMEVVGNFRELEVNKYTIILLADPQEGGNPQGGGLYKEGAEVTAIAYPVDGYVFEYWLEDGDLVSPDMYYIFTAQRDRTLIAKFSELTADEFSVELVASPVLGGEVSGGGIFPKASQVTVIASPNADYRFLNWTEGENEVSTELEYTFILKRDRYLSANFELLE